MPATKMILRCSDCGRNNYYIEKNRQNNPDKLVLSKFCKFCRAHTRHEEARIRK